MLPVSRVILLIFLANLFNTVTSAAIVLLIELETTEATPESASRRHDVSSFSTMFRDTQFPLL